MTNRKIPPLLDFKAIYESDKVQDYEKYGKDISKIIENPTYVARNPTQGSIEYIKEYKINNEFVLVAVRISNKGTMFAKTLF